MLLMEPSALKHWIVAGISLDRAPGSTRIVSGDSELQIFLGFVTLISLCRITCLKFNNSDCLDKA